MIIYLSWMVHRHMQKLINILKNQWATNTNILVRVNTPRLFNLKPSSNLKRKRNWFVRRHSSCKLWYKTKEYSWITATEYYIHLIKEHSITILKTESNFKKTNELDYFL